MKASLSHWIPRYRTALGRHLRAKAAGPTLAAEQLGRQAQAARWTASRLSDIHERALLEQHLPDCPAGQRAALIRRAGVFFAVMMTPPADAAEGPPGAPAGLRRYLEIQSARMVRMALANEALGREVGRRKVVEATLKQNERAAAESLAAAKRMQEQLRQLSRQVLSAQEEERKKISRDLHDVIAQALTGINLHLAALKKEASLQARGWDRSIGLTQQLVKRSAMLVHQFARELRPAVLDDLGLVPALHTYLKQFTARTGVRARLAAFAGIEQLDFARRTVLFRVTQEALTNVARHAKATRVDLSIQRLGEGICLQIQDNGRAFEVQSALRARGSKRLGLLGMRERLEMVGGTFHIESVPGRGTCIKAILPQATTPARRGPTNARNSRP